MSRGDTVPLHLSSQSDIDEIENLINASVQSSSATVLPARPPSPPRASIPISSSPFMQSNLPSPPIQSNVHKPPSVTPAPPSLPVSSIGRPNVSASGFGSPPDTLTEPVWDTVKRDLSRIISNLKLVVFPNPFREDPGKALRDWDLWGPFFFIVFLGLTLSWSASVKKACAIVFLDPLVRGFCCGICTPCCWRHCSDLECTAFGWTHNLLPSLSLLGYCLFPLDIGALICLLYENVIVKVIVAGVTLAWSSWAAYPFMSSAVNPRRKALALYPVLLMYVSVGFLIIAID